MQKLKQFLAAFQRVLIRLLIIVSHPVDAVKERQNGRNTLVTMAAWALNHREYWDYNEKRPVAYRLAPRYVFDCSGSVCWLYWCAGLKDPSGNAYSGSDTDTLTLLQHGLRINADQVTWGDVCILGAELPVGEQHAVMALRKGIDPWCFSHGQQGDPHVIRPSEDSRSKTWVRFETVRIHTIRRPGI